MVIVERFPDNMGNIVIRSGQLVLVVAIGLFALFVIAVIIVHAWATGVSLRHPRSIQNALRCGISASKVGSIP